jgi:small subunit ribosomal protein S15
MLSKDMTQSIVEQFGSNATDTGSTAVQIGLLNQRIRQISLHLKSFPKDFHSRHGLIKMVGRRKRFLTYLRRTDKALYDKLATQLEV